MKKKIVAVIMLVVMVFTTCFVSNVSVYAFELREGDTIEGKGRCADALAEKRFRYRDDSDRKSVGDQQHYADSGSGVYFQ